MIWNFLIHVFVNLISFDISLIYSVKALVWYQFLDNLPIIDSDNVKFLPLMEKEIWRCLKFFGGRSRKSILKKMLRRKFLNLILNI